MGRATCSLPTVEVAEGTSSIGAKRAGPVALLHWGLVEARSLGRAVSPDRRGPGYNRGALGQASRGVSSSGKI